MATTTVYQFSPTANANFTFLPTLDGAQYNVVVTWSLFGRRWMVNIYSTSGVLIAAIPLRGSPMDYGINLIAGYFSSTTMVYRTDKSAFEVTA